MGAIVFARHNTALSTAAIGAILINPVIWHPPLLRMNSTDTARPRCHDALDLEAARHALTRLLPVAENDAPWRALDYAWQQLGATRAFAHSVGTALIVAELRVGTDAIAAALLFDVDDTLELRAQFGNAAKLAQGVAAMARIEALATSATDKSVDNHVQLEALRHMVLAMVEDIRVVLIKLAERTQTMRTLAGASAEQQQLIAQQTRSIFAPLANRLGVWQLKWELEDLAVRYLEPALYKKVAKLLDERRVDRELSIAEVVKLLKLALAQAGISAEVSGRPKHIYSIINKMKRKQVDFSELYDVRAVRILVDDVEGCYTALGLVHDLWPLIDSEFDDYIAHPKSNNYRSLHTAVIGPRGLALEVQIRTHDMHHHSELGVAAHWRYKEGKNSPEKSERGSDEKIAWLRQILEWKEDLSDKGDMQEQFKNELFHDQVYVLTPQGKVIALPKGATPVDFAYSLHTDLGHRTRGAKIDGSIVPLNTKLQNAQRVEILTTKQGAPSRDWINPALGFLQSKHARASVRSWFKNQNFDESVALGRTQLDRELHRLGITAINQEKIAQRLHFNKLEDFLAAIGRNEITPRRIAVALQQELPTKVIEAAKPNVFKPATQHTSKTDITVGGVNNLMTRIAKCCNPVKGDDIVGYVTRDRGITIHRQDCAFMLHLMESRIDRKLTAQWG